MSQHPTSMPSPHQAKEGYRLAVENAIRHLRCGEAIASHQEYGTATSHMVLAAEEASKSLVLLMLSEGVEVPSRAVTSILSQHKPRHFAGALLALMEFFTTNWVNLITSLSQDFPDTTTPEYVEARKVAVAGLVANLNRIADAAPGEEHITDVMDWWTNSNLLKQRGFYVDHEGGQWVGPFTLTHRDYAAAHEIAGELIEFIQGAIRAAVGEPAESRRKFVDTLNQDLRSWRARMPKR